MKKFIKFITVLSLVTVISACGNDSRHYVEDSDDYKTTITDPNAPQFEPVGSTRIAPYIYIHTVRDTYGCYWTMTQYDGKNVTQMQKMTDNQFNPICSR